MQPFQGNQSAPVGFGLEGNHTISGVSGAVVCFNVQEEKI